MIIKKLYPDKIQYYVTDKNKKMLAHNVREVTGSDVVINGSLFDAGKWVALCDNKSDGVILCDDQYSYNGLGWDNDDTEMYDTVDIDRYDNYISCVMLVRAYVDQTLYLTPDVARRAGRTAVITHSDGGVTLFVTKEGEMNMTPYELREYIKANIKDCQNVLMLDGGGSSQLSQDGDDYIYSGRYCHNYLCFWEGDAPTVQQSTEDVEDDEMSTGCNHSGYVKPYLKSVSGSTKLSDNFTVSEFACNDGSDPVFVSDELVDVLQDVRDYFGKSVTITSAYRTPKYNKQVGGVSNSQHCLGIASDIVVFGTTPTEVYNYLSSKYPNTYGIGLYNSFVHVDVRATKARW